ncbi:Secreted effector protein PipB [Pelagimonas phthalicica]|uniref:Secreted effector protein PipB n=1 Tax=Pelagimonas phthalicica TaxID=1037362 RepID=A0A238JBH9_9RHOB|nr:pentapeptide repeat-containing protein [Pelagimonas phthalicica]TDS90971.1 pentapeptide repeat protein [Pelagimonas phthalicica]SMX28018.1 Secreted effector protein PipB [Pelagimonas phthalicica]
MANKRHIEWLREGIISWNARREKDTTFVPDLTGADLRGLELEGVNLRSSKLDSANFSGAIMRNADLRKASLRSAILVNANLHKSTLYAANLSAANLRSANLSNANLQEADLTNSILIASDLSRGYFSGTNFEGSQVASDLTSKPTDLRLANNLSQQHLQQMIGDRNTFIPKHLFRPEHWYEEFEETNESADLLSQLELAEGILQQPLVKASFVDFKFSDEGVEAVTPEGQDLRAIPLGTDCALRASDLAQSARDIAETVSNKLGEDTKADLIRYADHLESSDTGNPHRLVSLTVGIKGDLEDPFVSEALSSRLKRQLEHFLSNHVLFLGQCFPQTAESVEVKANTEPSREVTKEEVTEVLNTLESAILDAEAATESYSKTIAELRAHDDALNDMMALAIDETQINRVRAAVQREAVELASFGSRLLWRAKQAIARVRLHAGDLAIAGTLAGQTAEQMAQAVVKHLDPVIRLLRELFTVLPPV